MTVAQDAWNSGHRPSDLDVRQGPYLQRLGQRFHGTAGGVVPFESFDIATSRPGFQGLAYEVAGVVGVQRKGFGNRCEQTVFCVVRVEIVARAVGEHDLLFKAQPQHGAILVRNPSRNQAPGPNS